MDQQVSLDQPLSDAFAALTQLVVAVKAKKSPAEIAASELVNVVRLIEELPQVPADMKSVPQQCLNSAGLGLASLTGALLGL